MQLRCPAVTENSKKKIRFLPRVDEQTIQKITNHSVIKVITLSRVIIYRCDNLCFGKIFVRLSVNY